MRASKNVNDRTPKRKRMRMETVTPRQSIGKNASGKSAVSATRGGEESNIVWKDSPVEKQIKVSGTGKMAVRKEMQGFVGRLERASLESPSTVQQEEDEPTPQLLQEFAFSRRTTATVGSHSHSASNSPDPRRNATGGINKGVIASKDDSSISRQILFSPDSKPRGTPPCPNHGPRNIQYVASESQDEILTVIDKIDKKYASEPAMVTLADMNLSATPTSVSVVQQVKETTTTTSYTTPEKTAQPPQQSTQITESPDFGSPLTEESWELLDQLEYEASQRVAVQASQSLASTQVLLPSQPSQSSSHTLITSASSVLPAVPTRSSDVHQHAQIDQTSHEDYKRFLVLEVGNDHVHRRLTLRLLDDQEEQAEALLMDDWYDTIVEAGDTINIVFTERDTAGYFSQRASTEYEQKRSLSDSHQIRVDSDKNVVIVHPDILVSPTSVTTSFGCLRRAILRETLNVNRPTHPKAFLGTLKHDLFERALLKRQFTTDFLLTEVKRIVSSNIIGLLECGLNEETALLELNKVTEDYQKWLGDAFQSGGALLNEAPPALGVRVKVHHVLATEEMMWSIKWGLKGATDASIEAKFTAPGGEVPTVNNNDVVVLPLELKTGSKAYSGLEHQGQVILYTLLLNERYRQRCQDGLLMYVPGIETNRVTAMATHIRGLIITRNNFASAMAKVKAVGSSTSSQILPAMIRSRRECERCFQIDECVLHHNAVENGTKESSGLEELFTTKIGHLIETDLAYFKHWNRLIDLEQQHAERNLRALWLQVGWKREQLQESSTCIANLRLVGDEPAHSDSDAKRLLRFQRDQRHQSQLRMLSFQELRFRTDERVILSAESYDGKKLLVHIARGKIFALESGLISVEVYQSIPSIVTNGKSSVGKDYTWRLDKDSILSGLSRAKENLVKLFIGKSPEVVTAGTSAVNRPELSSTYGYGTQSPNAGDTRRRYLIVHLVQPRFRSCRVSELVMQRCNSQEHYLGRHASTYAELLLDEFSHLNIDQQRAVQKILNSLDYALLLGMPGTGKTSTIAFAVRILLFLGYSVLVTSYTHSAVDNLLLKLLEYKLPMVRIGNPAQVHPRITDFTLEHQAKQDRIATVADMEAKMVRAQLVGCTCLSVNSHVLFAKRRFDFCIVDEATQITQPVVLGALRCADTFVLVGDHYQLPPLVTNPQARKEGMDMSLFRRLSEAHPAATQQLSFQYRMNGDIMLLANQLVYGNKLKCGSHRVASNHLRLQLKPTNLIQPLAWPLQILTNDQGVIFLDTDRMPEAFEYDPVKTSEGSSRERRRMENVVEAQLVVGLVELLILGGVSAEEIAVISPFRSQVVLISRQLNTNARRYGSRALGNVEVSTIDKYQGKDKDVVLVSFVRCNEDNHVGELLTDWRRINVALTRAKQKLLLVGSESTLSGGSALFNVLSQVIHERHWIYRLPSNALKELDDIVKEVHGQHALIQTSEPEPEGEYEGATQAIHDSVEVSFFRLHNGNTGDIEGLVPDIHRVNHHPKKSSASATSNSTAVGTRHRSYTNSHQQPKPITRDIFGEI